MQTRMLVRHVWMLVALQVTTVRTLLSITDGLLTWVLKSWLQLTLAGGWVGIPPRPVRC
jgi:hypothetical protein